MQYILKTMTAQDRELVLSHASEIQRRRFIKIPFFETHPNLTWAVENNRASYLLRGAKSGDIRSRHTTLYFGFKGHLVEIEVVRHRGQPSRVTYQEEFVEDAEAFQRMLVAALSVHGEYGGAFPEVSLSFTLGDA